MRKTKLLFTFVCFVLAVLCFNACSNSLTYKDSGSLNFELSKDFYNQLSERSGTASSNEAFDVQVQLYVNDAVYSTDTKQLDSSETSISFDYKGIPVKSKVYAAVMITLDDIEYASGKSETITIKSGANALPVSLKLMKFSIPRTQYMIGKLAEDHGYDYYLRNSPDAVIKDSDTPDFTNVIDYCFDKDGNVFVLDYDDDDNIYINSNQKGFIRTKLKDRRDQMEIDFLFSDMATGEVYYTYKDYGSSCYCFASVTSHLYFSGYLYQILDGCDELLCITAYDNNFYFFYSNSNNGRKYYYVKRKVTVSSNEMIFNGNDPAVEIDIKSGVLNNTESGYNFDSDHSCDFSNVYYQDGYLYLFFTYESTDVNERPDLYSYGGIIRIKPDNNEIKTLGFSADVRTFKQEGGLQVYIDRVNYYVPVLNSENKNDRMTISYSELLDQREKINNMENLSDIVKNEYINYMPFNYFDKKIYQPSSASSTKLFGPRRLAALRPKQLVFTDNGNFIYVDGNIWRYKNVSRVVIVNLEDFSIKKVISQNYDSYSGDEDNQILFYDAGINSSYCGNVVPLVKDDTTIHYYDENTHWSQNMGSGLKFGIPYAK